MRTFIAAMILGFAAVPASAWQSQEVGVTSSCAGETTNTVRVCHPTKRITTYTTNVVSRNCTGDIRTESVQNGCVVYTLYAKGCGEDVVNVGFTKIRNCKGRGWISVRVNVPD